MSLAAGYRLVSIDRDRGAEMLEVDSWAFTGDFAPGEAEDWLAAIPFDRARAMEIADPGRGPLGELAAVNSSYTFRMAVPGGEHVPVAGLTFVGVHTGHRRRGLLRAMMADHLADARRRGEVASALYAAESEIYQRFGYGLAAQQLTLRVPRRADLREVAGADALTVRLERLSLERHGRVMRTVQARLARPGTMTLESDYALQARFCDPVSDHRDSERLRIAIVEDGDEPVAYAILRRKADFGDDSMPSGKVTVQQHAALTPAATHRLWSVLADIDLMATVHAAPFAVDDALVHMLVDLRSAAPRLRDNLWLRLVDVPAALTARSYVTPVDVVVRVEDPLFPDNAGPWRITTRDGEGHVEDAHGAEPHVVIGIQELSAAYLGGASVEALASAGLVEERRPGAVRALAAALGWVQAPVCNLFF
ncbi:GNAT family N-acetyltransferase [Demequina pelophila]|uniref:GNAT family N-acetyltransferase n=1 Tax=Demequina pelophila TaxID=1638984 RepID=UPI0007846CCF|nr:GNAT family N-acetyltransferase [Demequina pelophila]